jgi:DNA-binding transcriptional ArsR family regulator
LSILNRVIETFAALAEPNRLRIVELLRSGPRTVNQIGGGLGLNQPQVSKHLRVLRDAGLVDVEPRAQQRVHALRAGSLRRLHDWLERYRGLWDARFAALDELLVELQEGAAAGEPAVNAGAEHQVERASTHDTHDAHNPDNEEEPDERRKRTKRT